MNVRYSCICIALISFLCSGCAAIDTTAQRDTYIPEISVNAINNKISNDEIRKIIINACIRRKWNINIANDNIIQATLLHHGKTVIEILYSKEEIVIRHKESSDIWDKAGESDKKTLSSYNRWVRNLEMDIRRAILNN
ncbi:MAG: hypothetical protein J1E80_04655 [Desulfovibrionaceae bacterium]|nr:hypothetical protein [Desulfovibrionaceae bacterium]